MRYRRVSGFESRIEHRGVAMRVLVDMDGVIADWGAAYGAALDAHGPAAAGIPRHHQQTSFDLLAGRTDDEKRVIWQVLAQPGFYAGLAEIPGAHTALSSILRAGHDVRFVSSPWPSNVSCASDKLAWVGRHYGPDWVPRVILTTDKTLVYGDLLIDDKPEVTGAVEPFWEHVLFDQPYNRSISRKRRMFRWDEWETIING